MSAAVLYSLLLTTTKSMGCNGGTIGVDKWLRPLPRPILLSSGAVPSKRRRDKFTGIERIEVAIEYLQPN